MYCFLTAGTTRAGNILFLPLLLWRSLTFISGFGRKGSGFKFVGHFALEYIFFSLSFRETWFLFPGEALAFTGPAACRSRWSLPYPWQTSEAVGF